MGKWVRVATDNAEGRTLRLGLAFSDLLPNDVPTRLRVVHDGSFATWRTSVPGGMSGEITLSTTAVAVRSLT
jgi:hypothetical protein